MMTTIQLDNDHTLELEIPEPAQRESFFLFGLHKAGSVLLNRAFSLCAAELGVPTIQISRAAFRTGLPDDQFNASPGLAQVLFPNGYCYTGFRYFPPYLRAFFEAQPRLAILLIRDPRDILTSLFFSVAYSHSISPGEAGSEQLAARDRALALGIDAYALENIDFVRNEFISYEGILPSPRTKLYRYEDVVFSKIPWLQGALEFLGESLPTATLENIVEQVDRRPARERPNKHVRRVTPGDHREKLQPATIARLNDAFSDILERFNYAL
jgi:hypothetical protein